MKLSQEWSSDFGDWLSRISPRRQHLFILTIGIGLGSLVGMRTRYEREIAGEFSDNFTITEFTVKNDKIKNFEDKWNKNALVIAKKPGYEWTKLYKSIYNDNGNTLYLQLRKWRFKPENDLGNEFSAKTVVNNVKTVIDDSMGRNIPY